MAATNEIRTKTLSSYNQHVEEYLHKKDVLDEERTAAYWQGVDYFLSQLDHGDTIYEIESGSGYDAVKIEQLGFTVIRSDASSAFLEILNKHGRKAHYYDVLDGPLNKKVFAIYANAVLLHFNVELFRLALDNIFRSLRSGGYLCLGMKLGDFEGWRDKGLSGSRYFKFWHQDALRQELQKTGFEVLNEYVSADGSFIVITAGRN